MSHRPIRMAALAAVALLIALPASWADPEEIAWDRPDKKWRVGPVKYLLTDEEDKEYKGLKNDEARAQFVQAFWERRDPTPGTPANEYREAFYTNAREAAARFTEDGGKGWQDDRGRVYILLGPPDDISEEEGLIVADSAIPDAAAGGPGGLGGSGAPSSPTRTVRFIYFDDPIGDEGRRELVFRSDVTGGFRLQERIDWDAPILRGLAAPQRAAATPPPAAVPPTPPESGMPIPAPPAAPAVPVIEEAPPTPESDLMDQVREMADPPTAIPLKLNVNYYLARGDSTAATLTLEVPKESLPPGTDPETLIVSAEVLDAATGESAQRFFQDDQFGASTEGEGVDGVHLFQSQRSFLPGKYRAVFAVKDPSSGTVGVLKRDIEVPQFNAADLAISTVTFVHTLERLPEAEETETFEPFVLGNFKVVPRTDVTYRHGEELTFYYQIYGAQKDETTGKPKVDLTYAFEKKHGGRWIMLGREPLRFAGQDALVQAYGLTIQPSFPGGDYRVRIEVTDTLSGRKKSVELPFIVDAPEKAAK